ncbi:LIC_11502 family protein [Leptospira alstonii]|uniref:Uncharacterized protein n=2 Tax=Leptospira alstonii TaxID=28452 RepID=M6CRG1_9LEPT|nr:hypothetical protein [Leptospira alstonii]EMJ93116.1 hypothetical protein LEP1GSC194_1772 [Leptospira alstonii serovar Sichuan str. 79601]EQA78409.1 hypothetical protein LEP1GSC193_4118 [Leptospira alstonii serovar Pingchang str. 80-412]
MQKELSEKTELPTKEIELFPNHSDSIVYSDIVTAVRLALPAKDKDLSQIGKNLTVSKFSERENKSLKTNRKLSKQIVFASVVGALKGFGERDLKPFHINHRHIFTELGSEVLKTLEVPDSIDFISNEDKIQILKNAFDYGIRKVYHLEWKLYTSRELY